MLDHPRRNYLRTAVVLMLLFASPLMAADDQLVFIGVAIDDDTTAADDKLLSYLAETEDLRFREGDRQHSYEEVINALRGLTGQGHVLEPESRNRFVARATPYVLVAAQMLGAQLEVLATYTNHQDATTYRSNFVVNRERFQERYGEPTKDSLLRYLKEAETPASFVYHDRFSTSSFFLPSLFFRRNSIFSTTEPMGGDQTAIESVQLPAAVVAGSSAEPKKPGSTDLVKAVARGDYDLAAVWDGTRRKFEEGGSLHELGDKVMFFELDVELPNDLLVAPASLDPRKLDRLRHAISQMREREIDLGDFASWTGIQSDRGRIAGTALATLRIDAQDQLSSPAVVRISAGPGTENLVGAVENAVRRMGNDYTLYDPAFHRKHDVLWTLERLHDDQVVSAIELISKIEHSDIEEQPIPISFDSPRSLTERIVDVARKRLHRIAYVWPYLQDSPTVIHDFDLIPEDEVRVRPIRRGDLRRNDYKLLGREERRVAFERADDFRLQLDSKEFESTVRAGLAFDPLSNVVYRVVLPRPKVDRTLFRTLTGGLVGLFVLAAVGLLWDLRAALRAQPIAESLVRAT